MQDIFSFICFYGCWKRLVGAVVMYVAALNISISNLFEIYSFPKVLYVCLETFPSGGS